jgi:iron complex transport system ATP-binding protein
MLEARRVSVRFGAASPVRNASLEVSAGVVTALVGPNGAGKSTLLAALAGDIVPADGDVVLDGESMSRIDLRERARRRAVVRQRGEIAFGFSVVEIVLLGRHAHGDSDSGAGLRTARESLAFVDAEGLETRDASTLSGGEFARVALARALTQVAGAPPPAYLLLDEPVAALDPAHQRLVLRGLREIAGRHRLGALVVLHDLNLAARYADQVAIMRDGTIRGVGAPHEVLTVDAIRAAFDLGASIVEHPVDRGPVIVFDD